MLGQGGGGMENEDAYVSPPRRRDPRSGSPQCRIQLESPGATSDSSARAMSRDELGMNVTSRYIGRLGHLSSSQSPPPPGPSGRDAVVDAMFEERDEEMLRRDTLSSLWGNPLFFGNFWEGCPGTQGLRTR